MASPTSSTSAPLTLESIRSLFVIYKDFPKVGISFCDIHPIMRNHSARQFLVNILYERYKDQRIDIIVGLESRGYYLGVLLADRLSIPFVPVRKEGKLPGEKVKIEYGSEYKAKETMELQKESVPPGSRVIVVDDSMATGGTAKAAVELLRQCQAVVVEMHCQLELAELGGRAKLDVPFFSLFTF
eukprot:TRINITY_DN527_c0_g1_i1.p1 TRINITY_DN527_c0_g1~~TRINITY_DN527_c0_g1_i1.p1  ORF type:complete len:185 (-),score=37.98 TRINITY_DN527_c0_g1_i1:187-741(-)